MQEGKCRIIKVKQGLITVELKQSRRTVGFVGELVSSQEVKIGETWLFVRVFEDVIHFEDMKGNFLGVIKKIS